MAVAPPQLDVLHSQIKIAMRSRIVEFKDQLDSLTFVGARRLLEKDLGLEPCALDLDFHKKFVKEQLAEDELFECVSSLKLKNKELTKAKELAEEAKRQAEKAEKEVEEAKKKAVRAKEVAEKSISGFKSKTGNMEQHIADLQRQLDEARASVSQAMDDFKATEACDELLLNLVGPYMEAAFHNFQVQGIADLPQLENNSSITNSITK